MGLDMYLMDAEGAEVGYWRKANAIHGWFVRELAGGVDECQPIHVSRENLITLRQLCLEALRDRNINEVPEAPTRSEISLDDNQDIGKILAERMASEATIAVMERDFDDASDPLRPTAGFFFGGNQKDEYYYQDLMETINIISQALSGGGDAFIYQASW
jgi:hypothetical protein